MQLSRRKVAVGVVLLLLLAGAVINACGNPTEEPEGPQGPEDPPGPSGLSTAYHFFWEGTVGEVDIDTAFPVFTVVRSVTLPAGNYVIIAGLNMYFQDTGGRPVNNAVAICRLTRAPGFDLDQVTLDPSGGDWLAVTWTEATLRGAVSLGDTGGTITLRCTEMGHPDAIIRASSTSLIAIQVDQVISED
jgi:hypothetical protein